MFSNRRKTRSFANLIKNCDQKSVDEYNKNLEKQLKNIMYPVFHKLCLDRYGSLITKIQSDNDNSPELLTKLIQIINVRDSKDYCLSNQWKIKCEEIIPKYAVIKNNNVEWDTIFNHFELDGYFNACYIIMFLEMCVNVKHKSLTNNFLYHLFSADKQFKIMIEDKMDAMDECHSDIKHWKGKCKYMNLFIPLLTLEEIFNKNNIPTN